MLEKKLFRKIYGKVFPKSKTATSLLNLLDDYVDLTPSCPPDFTTKLRPLLVDPSDKKGSAFTQEQLSDKQLK